MHSADPGSVSRLMLLTLLVLAALLPACSARDVYRSLYDSKLQECRRLPVWQQEHCLSLYDTPYEEYRREREAIPAGEGLQTTN